MAIRELFSSIDPARAVGQIVPVSDKCEPQGFQPLEAKQQASSLRYCEAIGGSLRKYPGKSQFGDGAGLREKQQVLFARPTKLPCYEIHTAGSLNNQSVH